MSVTFSHSQIDESNGEINRSSIQYERKYRVFASQTAEEADVIGYMRRNISGRIGDIPIESISCEAQDGARNKVWVVTVRWKYDAQSRKAPSIDDYPKQDLGLLDESFQTQEERKKMTFCHSERVVTRTGYGSTTFYNSIGQSGEGVEVGSPAFQFSINRRFDYTLVTSGLRNRWLELFGCLNSTWFWGFAPGVVRFTGFSGRSTVEYDGSLVEIEGQWYQAAQAYYDVTFNFQAKPIAATQDIGGIICANVPGWSYPWVETIKVDDEDTGRTVDMPVAVHIATLYPSANLNLLLY